MNDGRISTEPGTQAGRYESGRILVYIIAIVGSFLIIGWMARLLSARHNPDVFDTAKNEERWKTIREFKAANAGALDNYAWQDQAKGFVRLRLERAKELTLQEAGDPKAARANLLSRADKAAAPAPPPPNQFE